MFKALMWLCGVALVGAAQAQTSPPNLVTTFDPTAIEKGRAQYQRSCAQCHGRNMVNSGTTVYDLRRFPQDQPDRFMQSVVNGKGYMPSFKSFDMQTLQALWAYVGSRGGKEP